MKRTFNLKTMVSIALVTAVICVVSPFSLPIGPVPISLSLFAIYIGLYILGWKLGTVSILLYILLGLVGVPVFSNFSAGPAKLFGPTGGYIVGYIFVGIIGGLFLDKFRKIYMDVIGLVLALLVCYAFGTLWFVTIMDGYTIVKALSVCVFPFIPGDIIKIALAVAVGPILRKQISKVMN